jgi:hypothetical protein
VSPGSRLRRVLILNAGSSSLKWSVLDVDRAQTLDQGAQPWVGADPAGHVEVLRDVLASLPTVDAVGHRVVHGGAVFDRAVVVDRAVRAAIAGLTELAPLHNPAALAGIDAVSAARPGAGPGRGLRHRLSPNDPRGRRPLRAAVGVERGLPRRHAAAALRLPRPERRARRRPRDRAGPPRRGHAAGAAGRLSPRRGLLDHRGARRALGRHDDGLHAARRSDDGDALGRAGPTPSRGSPACPPCARGRTPGAAPRAGERRKSCGSGSVSAAARRRRRTPGPAAAPRSHR